MTSDPSPSGDLDPSSSPPQKRVSPTPEAGAQPENPAAGTSPAPEGAVGPAKRAQPQTPSPRAPVITRAAAAWLATAVALAILVLFIILILQNQNMVEVHYLGFAGSIPLGTALFIGAVAGAALVAIVGVARLTQLRITARRAQRREARDDDQQH
jgi:uncharacterized integral membrane protein